MAQENYQNSQRREQPASGPQHSGQWPCTINAMSALTQEPASRAEQDLQGITKDTFSGQRGHDNTWHIMHAADAASNTRPRRQSRAWWPADRRSWPALQQCKTCGEARICGQGIRLTSWRSKTKQTLARVFKLYGHDGAALYVDQGMPQLHQARCACRPKWGPQVQAAVTLSLKRQGSSDGGATFVWPQRPSTAKAVSQGPAARQRHCTTTIHAARGSSERGRLSGPSRMRRHSGKIESTVGMCQKHWAASDSTSTG